MGMQLHHLAVVVKDLEIALAFYRDGLGLPVGDIEDVPREGVRVAFLPLGDSQIELMEPIQEDTGITKWMSKHGQGMHHLCLEVPDIEAALARLAAHGAQLINPEPVTRLDELGAVKMRYAFVHPRSTGGVLLELYETPTSAP
jgi:methylmalonyl-CoA/ethylmalonyl-CoA epimerase